ncbi:MAG: phage tail tape measure protein [Magnetococcales bacterium]|nr:phage tail tape measure protein [Magnetococcales bacterium]
MANNTLEFFLRMNVEQFVRATAQVQQEFNKTLSGLTGAAAAEGAKLSSAMSGLADIDRLKQVRQQLADTHQSLRSAQLAMADYARQITEANAPLEKLKTDLAGAKTSFAAFIEEEKASAAATAQFRAKVQELSAQFRQTTNPTAEMARELATARAELKRMQDESTGLGTVIKKTMADINRLTAEIEKTPGATDKMTKGFQAAQAEVTRLGEAQQAARLAVQQAAAGLSAAGISVRTLSTEEERLRTNLQQANERLQEHARIMGLFAQLGVRPVREVQEEIQKLKTAYQQLAASGQASSRDLARAHEQLKVKTSELQREMSGTGTSMHNVATAAGTLLAAMYSLQQVSTSTLTKFAEFDTVMCRVEVVMESSGEQTKALRSYAEEMGKTTTFSAKSAADGLLVLATAGMKADDAMQTLPTVMHMATVAAGESAGGIADIKQSADTLLTIMNSSGFKSNNLTAISDVIVQTAQSSMTTVNAVGESLKRSAATAKSAGIDFLDLAAVIGVMADGGYRGERAGTALASSIQRMLRPTAQMQEVMDRLGLVFQSSPGKLIPLIDIFKQLEKSEANASDLSILFGLHHSDAMNVVKNKGVTVLQAFRKELLASGDSSRQAAEHIEGGLGGAMERLSAILGVLGQKVGEDLAPNAERASTLIHGLAKAFLSLDDETRKNIEGAALLIGALATMVLGVIPLTSALWGLAVAGGGAAASVVLLNRAVKTSIIGLAVWGVYEAGKYIHLWGEEATETAGKMDHLTDAVKRQDDALKQQNERAKQQEAEKARRKAEFERQKNVLKATSPELAGAIGEQEQSTQRASERKRKADAEVAALQSPANPPGKPHVAEPEDRFHAFKTELDRQKEASGNYFRETLQMEEQFWQEKRSLTGLSAKDLAHIDHEIYQIHKQQAHDSLNERLELLREQMDKELEGSQQRIDIAKKAAQEIGDTYGYESKEFVRARRVIESEERAHRAKMNEFASLQIGFEKSIEDNRIAGQQESLRFNQEMEIMSVREVMQAKQAMEEQSFQNTMRAMEAELALKRQGSTEQIKLQNDIKLAVLNHNLAIQKSNNDLAIQARNDFHAMMAPIQTAIGSSLSGLVTHQTTVQQAMNTLLKAELDQFTGFLAKRFSLWAENQLAETALGKAFGLVRVADQGAESTAKAGIKAGEGITFQTVEGLKLSTTLSGSAARVAGQTTESTAINAAKTSEGVVATTTEGVKAAAAATGLGTQAAADTESIGMSAWTGMANAYASISAIPMVGPFLAPAIAAGVFASIIALVKNLFSAEGGFDIPAGINPVTQLHEREMVLPKAQADAVRSMAANGTGGNVTIHVSTLDTKGFESWLHTNAHTLAPALRKLARNAVPVMR